MKSTEKLAGIVEKFTEDANRSVNVAATVVAGGAALLLAMWLWIIMVMWAITHWQQMMLIILGLVAVFAALAIWGMWSSTTDSKENSSSTATTKPTTATKIAA